MATPHDVYAALGDPTRLAIVQRLCERGPLPTLTLVEGLGMSRQAATKHLLVLESAGLVETTSRGREKVRELRLEVMEEARDWLSQRAAAWDKKLDALRAFVEALPTEELPIPK